MNTPPWARQAYNDWQSAIEATRQMQQVYNDWLSKIDRINILSEKENPQLQKLRAELGELLSIQVQFFQQITPWIDAKIQELRLEENHNVTFHVGTLLEKLNEMHLQIVSLEQRLSSTIRSKQPAPPETRKSELSSPPSPSEKDFRYHAFEQIFRQSSHELKQSLQRYIPVFSSSPEPLLDLGCGRGEFLQLMKDAGKQAYGVDISAYETEKLQESGLDAIAGDLLSHLKGLSNESIGGVFCAQVVEHLHPDEVYGMVSELFRVMKSNSPLVLETLNPLSVFSYHHLFFKDPTHVFPVHPDTLVFMMKYAGFRDVQMHSITPAADQQKLPEPRKEDFGAGGYEYLKSITSRINDFLYGSLEYYVLGFKR